MLSPTPMKRSAAIAAGGVDEYLYDFVRGFAVGVDYGMDRLSCCQRHDSCPAVFRSDFPDSTFCFWTQNSLTQCVARAGTMPAFSFRDESPTVRLLRRVAATPAPVLACGAPSARRWP